MDVSGIVSALRARALWPVIMPLVKDTLAVVSSQRPQAVILQAGQGDWQGLLLILHRRGIPYILVGTAEQLRRAAGHDARCVHLLLPVEPYEVAKAAQLVVGPLPPRGPSDIIDLGIVKIDLRAHDVEVEGERKALPPKEFEILVQLALQPGTPLDATELLGRVWNASDAATVNDLHTRIWRLRRGIGDHDRKRPLIVNRRGFGYLLNVPQSG